MRLSSILLAVIGSAGIVTVHSQELAVPRLLQVVEVRDLKGDPPPDPIGERASRAARVEIDVARLYQGPSKKVESSVAPIPGLTLDVEVFPGEVYRLQGVRATQSAGVWSWSAKVADDEAGHAVLTIDRGAVFGTLQVTGHHFTIITDHSGRQWAREDDPKQALDDLAIGTPTGKPGDKRIAVGPTAPKGGSSTTLDVLIL